MCRGGDHMPVAISGSSEVAGELRRVVEEGRSKRPPDGARGRLFETKTSRDAFFVAHCARRQNAGRFLAENLGDLAAQLYRRWVFVLLLVPELGRQDRFQHTPRRLGFRIRVKVVHLCCLSRWI